MSDEVTEFIEAVKSTMVGRNGYTKMDRYRDFKKVFSTEHGKRVLAQIMDLCEGSPITIHDVEDHAKLSYRAGMKYAAIRVAAITLIEPTEMKIERKETNAPSSSS